MPLQNRVTPYSKLEAAHERGMFMGNRGCLHDSERRIVREFRSEIRWICCLTEFKGRKRNLMTPRQYTELFFLDEATAFAAGHRPCKECRRSRFLGFLDAWHRAFGERPGAREIDERIHRERSTMILQGSRPLVAARALPDGAMVQRHDQAAWLLYREHFHRWSHAGYSHREPATPDEEVMLLTIPIFCELFRHGFTPELHPSAI